MADLSPLRRPASAPAAAARPVAGDLPDLRFGPFELQVRERRLLQGGTPVALQARALDLLIVLARHPGQLLGRQQLLDRVWPGLVVEENNLSVQINALRKALGAQWISTVPTRGYRFSGPVEAVGAASAAVAPLPARPNLVALPDTHLPAQLPPLIGRGAELAALASRLDTAPLVTLTGAGGIGKTRLAMALLHGQQTAHAHGVCFVELAAVQQADAVPLAVAGALGLRLPAGDDHAAALAQALAPLQLLLALDNAEHVVPAVAALARALGRAAPGVRLLVTSQVPLQVAGEQVFRLGALGLPGPGSAAAQDPRQALQHGAVALFVSRAQALDHHFALTADNLADVLALCRSLDGSALAIELAASRLPLLGLPTLVRSLVGSLMGSPAGALQPPPGHAPGGRLDMLGPGPRDAPPRQQTLRAALQWSHALLDADTQRVFRRLAVFVGSAPLGLALAVLADEDSDAPPADADGPAGGRLDRTAVLDAMGRLVDRSLLSVLAAPDGAGALAPLEPPDPRYRLLEGPLALARELLPASGEAAHLQRRHALALAQLFDTAHGDLLHGRCPADALADRLAPDLDNAQAALRWALVHAPGLAGQIAPMLSTALGAHRHQDGEALWARMAPLLASPSPLTPDLLARCLLRAAEQGQNTRPRQALAQAQQAQALAMAQGDQRLACLALRVVGFAAMRLDDRATLLSAVQQGQALDDPTWPAYLRVVQASNQAWLALVDGDHAACVHWCLQQLALSRAAGLGEVNVLIKVGSAQLAAGHHQEAVDTFRGLATRLVGVRDQQHLCRVLSNLGAALLSLERAAEARAVLAQSWPLARRYDMLPQWADDAALVAALEGRGAQALQLAGYADAAFAALGQPREGVDQARMARALQLAQQALAGQVDAAGCARLQAAGAGLSADALPALLFGAGVVPN